MTPETAFALMAVIGALVVGGSVFSIRSTGAQPGLARRLAGPAEARVGRLLDDTALPSRPVRVAGRIRCREPLDAGDGERLVAFHRDVEVRIGGRWRSVERIRETRSFDLWDHDGSIPIDPRDAAEPLVAIPKVWRGQPSELVEPHASSAARLAERHGPMTDARAITRTLNVTDRLLVVGRPIRADDGSVRLEPPSGGYLVTNLALDDAMRLLAGRHRARAAAAVVLLAIGLAATAIGVVGLVVTLVLA